VPQGKILAVQGVKKDSFKPVCEAAGADGNRFGLVFDGIHRACHHADGFRQTPKQGVEHVYRGAFLIEIEIKVRYRQSAG